MRKPCPIINSWELVRNPAGRDCVQPAVSVVVTLYNYSAFIRGCLDSVRASKTEGLPGGFEVVVVDDGSTDASVQLVEEYMAAHDLPVCLVKKLANSGLADARNIGLLTARAPWVFILDADNTIRPECLLAHYQVLAASNHALAYGIINRFDHVTHESLGTMSHGEWQVRDLLSGPYIDAMAMVKKDTVLKLGGYSTEYGIVLPQGWEDYDLWLKLAQAGHSGQMIPQILSDYRVHGQSMLQKLTPYQDQLGSYFTRKFLSLVVQHDDLPALFGMPRLCLTMFSAQGKGFQFQAKSAPVRLIHRLLGPSLSRSLGKRLAELYCWLHP